MVVDTSVIIHIYLEESDWQASLAVLRKAERLLCSVASLIEAQAVITKRVREPKTALKALDDVVENLNLEIVPFTLKQSRLAREAYLAYGKGQGHPAGLNYGDVMSYALAADTGERLAFVGDDFNHTNLKVIRLPPNL